MGSRFGDELAVERRGEGRFAAHLDEVWNLRPLPQGGVVTALALQAMSQVLGDPAQRLRTLHTTFVGQVAHGPVDIEVELLRRGRSMSHLRAEVRNTGSPRGHVTTAVFGSSRWGFEFTDLVPPDVPAPEECPSFRDPPPPGFDAFPPMPFWDAKVEGRPALGHPPWEDYEPDAAERAMWYRCETSPLEEDGTVDPLALVVLADTMPGAVSERIGRSDTPWFGPSVDLSVHLLEPCRSEWVLAHNRARHAGDGYASVDMALWDPGNGPGDGPRLVAYATQVCFFVRMEGPG
jgi:acyl-CoA thioesterase